VDDAEDDWTYSQKFDFIHGRLLFSAFKSPAKVIQNAFNALALGGYLEMQEAYFKLHSVDESSKGTAFENGTTCS
jgi:Methyltransferase domain